MEQNKCNKCGRPMQYATEPKCNYCDSCMSEYCGCKLGRIKEIEPTCDSTAVIPSITVDSIEGITNLANCLVHVNSTNTTYYVDDKHRIMITWAGPVNIPGYDMAKNPNHYKNQIVTDTDAKIAVIYDNNGRGFTFGIEQDADFTEAVSAATSNKIEQMAADGEFKPILDDLFNDYYDELQEYTDSQLGNKVDKNGVGQITYNNLSQSIREMLTGGNTPVVGIGAVSTDNIVDNTISYQKLNENGKNGVAGFNQTKTLAFDWEQGSRHNAQGELIDSSNTIVITEPFSLKMGLRIKVNDGYKAAVYTHDENAAWFMWSGFEQKDFFIGNAFNSAHLNSQFYISIRKTDDSDLTPSEGFDAVTVTEPQANVKPSYSSLDLGTQRLINGDATTLKITDSSTLGSTYDTTIEGIKYPNGQVSSEMNRAFLSTPIFLPKGAVLTTTDGWEFILTIASTVPTTQKVIYPSGQGFQTSVTVPYNDVFYIQYRYEDNGGIYDTASDFINHLSIAMPPITSGNKIIYVSGTGNDDTGDGSYSSPYREITKAISAGANTIVCEGGYKYSPLNYTGVSNLRIVGEFPTYSAPGNIVQAKPYFDTSTILTGNTIDEGRVKIPYTAEQGSDMYACLVAKTKDVKDSDSTRSDGYYVTIYSDGDKDTSHRYIPVLEEDGVEGHFYYDGSYIYINPYSDNDVDTEYSLVDSAASNIARLVYLYRCHNITFENFCFKHAKGKLFLAEKCTEIRVVNCDFCGSSRDDNIAALNSNINITNCVSYLARNDGYNFHGFGESIVTKCIGCHCFDDGISHHDQCNHTITGGEYYDNHKGGISSPTYGCSSDITGCYIHDNTTGIHTGSDTDHGTSYINLNNNLVTRNTTGVRLSGCTGVMYNNKVVDNTNNINNTSSVVIYQ